MLSNVVDTQIATHALYGGVVPAIASRRHMEAVVRVTEQALADAGMDKHDVDAVAATCAPGLIGALLVGANFGKSLAFSLNKPFIPVHHIRGHIAATFLAYPELKPPFLTLIASGGHSEIVMVRDYTEFEILGGTQQLPLGAELVEHRSVLCERALYGQDAGHAVLCRLGIGRLFLRNIFNSYNHDYSLAPDEGSRRMRWGGVG